MRMSAMNNGRHRFFNYYAYDSSAVQSKTYVFFSILTANYLYYYIHVLSILRVLLIIIWVIMVFMSICLGDNNDLQHLLPI